MSDVDIQMVGLTKVVKSFKVPFTKYRLEIVKEILTNVLSDEVRKELTLLGFFKRDGAE